MFTKQSDGDPVLLYKNEYITIIGNSALIQLKWVHIGIWADSLNISGLCFCLGQHLRLIPVKGVNLTGLLGGT